MRKQITDQQASTIYKEAKDKHNEEIKLLKIRIKQAKQDIKRHKLLKKQAKTVYKLSKLS